MTWSCSYACANNIVFFFFQAEDGIRDLTVTGVQTCALPICLRYLCGNRSSAHHASVLRRHAASVGVQARLASRSEEHTSELQSQSNLVCRLLLEKKKDRVSGGLASGGDVDKGSRRERSTHDP